jgi:signal transduction histidine kinase
VGNDLARAITTFGEGLVADQPSGTSPEFRVEMEGASRELVPIVRDEVYRIAIESLRNAFRHAHARRIEVEIHYDPRQLRLRVRDNGNGIDPKVLDSGGRAGHHGLPGMHERAKLAGGKLSVWSRTARRSNCPSPPRLPIPNRPLRASRWLPNKRPNEP